MGSFLYPMLDQTPSSTADRTALLADLARSAQAKAVESRQTTDRVLDQQSGPLEQAASAMATAFSCGGRLFCFGNGGSATDAAGVSALFATPGASGRALPARSLSADTAVLTALANDIGVSALFTRQLIAFGRPGDIALGLSTSGGSANVLTAFGEGRRRGMLTIGLAGYAGGAMADCVELDHCLSVDAQSVHRTQEAQSALAYALCVAVRRNLAKEQP